MGIYAMSMMSHSGIGLLLQCPKCQAPRSLGADNGRVTCSRCHASFTKKADIIDFVAGASDTSLNVMEYDLQKRVSLDASLSLFRTLKHKSSGLIQDRLGTVLEIGAGTGLLTLGMITDSDFEHAVITDISSDMLAVCRERLKQVPSYKMLRTILATFSGGEQVFSPAQYDICLGSSILHHVLDYVALLETVRKALKPGGAAIFTEPGAPFHEALTLAMADALVSFLASHNASEALFDLARWIEHTRFRLRTNPAELAHLEDKHIFQPHDLRKACAQAGFSSLSMRPLIDDPLGQHAARNYLRELGIPDNMSAQFMPLYERHAKHHFRKLSNDDMCEMYLLAFELR